MSSSAGFRTRATVIVASVIGISFLLGLILPVLSDRFDVDSAQADSFSSSSIGHRAFVEMLEELGIEVVVSRARSGMKRGVLVIAEARVHPDDETSVRKLREMLGTDAVLLVLPKRKGRPDAERPSWLEHQDLVSERTAARVLDSAGIGGAVVRPPAEGFTPEWTSLIDDVVPDLVDPQLIRSDDLEPLIECSEGMLLGRLAVSDREVVVLADPDLIATHGLRRGRNAFLATKIIQRLRKGDAPVIFDETLHGFGASESVWRELLTFPLIIATMHVVLLLGLLVWATTGRFGRPLPPEPPIPPGKGFLIDNTAELLRFGGHTRYTLERYFQTTVQSVAHRLHAPATAEGDALLAWLQRVSEARGVGIDLAAVAERVRSKGRRRRRKASVEDVAAIIHRWRQEMIHGS